MSFGLTLLAAAALLAPTIPGTALAFDVTDPPEISFAPITHLGTGCKKEGSVVWFYNKEANLVEVIYRDVLVTSAEANVPVSKECHIFTQVSISPGWRLSGQTILINGFAKLSKTSTGNGRVAIFYSDDKGSIQRGSYGVPIAATSTGEITDWHGAGDLQLRPTACGGTTEFHIETAVTVLYRDGAPGMVSLNDGSIDHRDPGNEVGLSVERC